MSSAATLQQGFQTFPPAFDNNPFAYGFALAGLTILAAVSLGQMVRLIRAVQPHRDGYTSPITLGRAILFFLYCTIFIGAWPDIVVLLLWNEISNEAMEQLWATDRLFDGLTLLPFLIAVLISVRAEARLADQLLVKAPPPIDFIPPFQLVKKQLLMVGLICLMAFGVAAGKLLGAT